MMKKHFCLIALLLGANTAHAWQGNWLVGLSTGYNWYRGHVDIDTFSNNAGIITDFADFNATNHGRSWLWGALAGYQLTCNAWLLGLELNIDWQNRHNRQNYAFPTDNAALAPLAFTASTIFRRDETVGLTGRIGYDINCWFMPYLRAGVERSKDKLHVDAAEGGPLAIALFSLSSDASRHSYRFVGGVGAEVPIALFEGLTFRAEYNYHSKNKKEDATTKWTAPGTNPIVFSTIGARHETHTAKASVVYNFNL